MRSQTPDSSGSGQVTPGRGQRADLDNQRLAGQNRSLPGLSSPFAPRHRRTAARPDLAPALAPGGQGQTGTPGGALIALLMELAARGLPPAGMSLTRLEGTLTLPSGLAVRYGCGWLAWPTGRTSQRGRPLHTLHDGLDAAGAARRLARTPVARTAQAQTAASDREI